MFVVNTVKEEVCEEITDHDSESNSSMYDSVFNSSQPQRTSTSFQRMAVSQRKNSSNIPETDSVGASKMCVICGKCPFLVGIFGVLKLKNLFRLDCEATERTFKFKKKRKSSAH